MSEPIDHDFIPFTSDYDFKVTFEEVKTDLEKLIFTIKNAHIMSTSTASKPAFGEEDWLSIPMGELDIRNMSPEKYLEYQHWLVQEAETKRREEELKEEGKIETIKDLIKEGTISFKNIAETRKYSKETIEQVKKLLVIELIEESMLPLSSIAQMADVSEEFVREALKKKKTS